jgi:hypothetical protein
MGGEERESSKLRSAEVSACGPERKAGCGTRRECPTIRSSPDSSHTPYDTHISVHSVFIIIHPLPLVVIENFEEGKVPVNLVS